MERDFGLAQIHMLVQGGVTMPELNCGVNAQGVPRDSPEFAAITREEKAKTPFRGCDLGDCKCDMSLSISDVRSYE